MSTPDSRPQLRRVAVISGGSSGIGAAFVAALHAEGWIVHTCGRDTGRLAAVEQAYPGIRTRVCDVSDRASVEAWAAAVVAEVGAVDLLISNAGGLREIDFTSPSLPEVNLVSELRSNLEGTLNLIAAFIPALRLAAPASILIVSSGYGLAPATRAPVYSASKAALHSLAKSLRRQLAPLRIGVTELAPPVVDTPATANSAGAKMSPADIVQQALRGVRGGEAEVYPGAVRWLALLLRLAPSMAESIVART